MQKVIAVVGPTASGKSALGTYLAKKLRGEVISADSRQVYRGMHVISRAEKGTMVGFADPRRAFSAGEYAHKAAEALGSSVQKGRVPIIVGGTGFYAEALLRAPLPPIAPDKKLRKALGKKSAKQLLAMLEKLDQRSAARVDPFNKVRLVRAIEIARSLGTVPARKSIAPYKVLWLGLPIPKNYEKTLRRGVEERLRRGMLAEAKKLRQMLSKKRFAELGFEFDSLAEALDKKISKMELVEQMVRWERRYAKRQMRWFLRYRDIRFVKSRSEALRLAKKFLSR